MIHWTKKDVMEHIISLTSPFEKKQNGSNIVQSLLERVRGTQLPKPPALPREEEG